MKKNIIITGGGLINKGAQAMTFIAVSELKKRFPDHQILIMSPEDLKRPKHELEQYNFDFIGWYPQKFAKCQKNYALRLLCKLRNKSELEEAEAIYKNTDLMIDVSGYALGTGWSKKVCNDYLDNFEFARAFGIPVYLLPQSFGPFDFAEKSLEQVDRRARDILPSIKLICAREQDGFDALRTTYGLKNIKLLSDIVLNNKDIDLSHVYKNNVQFNIPDIVPNSAAVIPNNQNFTVNAKNQIIELYCTAIKYLIEQNRMVYLLHHSSLDLNVCKELKSYFLNEDRVILLEQDFSCVEFNEIVRKFDYMVASRFHSIVHAYKNGIPCITIGWAKKYEVLLSQFGQQDYLLDVRNSLDANKLLGAMIQLETRLQTESEKILSQLKEVQKDNIFDILEL